MRKEYDVIIVGAGINGLACGCYLQKAGLKVAVLEKRNECGPFALTEDIFGAGIPVDTHAGVCFIVMSPAWGDLELKKFGLDIIIPKVLSGALWRDKNVLFYSDPYLTEKSFAQFSKKDAKTFIEIMTKTLPDLPEIAEKAVFSPPTDEGEDYLFSLGKYMGFSERDMRTMNGLEMIELLYENEFIRLATLAAANIGVFGDPSEKGEGAVMTALAWALAIGVPKGGMHNLVHSLVRCFRHYGGTLLLNAPVSKVWWEGGKPKGVFLDESSPYPFDEIRAKYAIVMHTSPPISVEILGEENIKKADYQLWRKMKNWDMTGHCAFTSYFLIEGIPEWGSKSWNPDVQECAFPLRAWDSWGHAIESFQRIKNEEIFGVAGDVGEIYNLAPVDPTRMQGGKSVIVFEVEYPINLRRYGGVKSWDSREITDRMHEEHMRILENLAPGFTKKVLKSTYYTPIDNWRRNPSAILGHELGGDVSGAQWYQGRMPNRSSIAGLYFSQGVWPASLTHLGSGYVTACCIADDLGIREKNKDWWRHKPYTFWRGE